MRNVNLFQPRECRVFTEFGRYALGPLSSCFIYASFLSLFSALALCVYLETASEECGKRTTEKHILAHWRREACAEMAQVAVFRFSSCAATAFTHFFICVALLRVRLRGPLRASCASTSTSRHRQLSRPYFASHVPLLLRTPLRICCFPLLTQAVDIFAGSNGHEDLRENGRTKKQLCC